MVVGLLYANEGDAILAVGDTAMHKVWKWTREERLELSEVKSCKEFMPNEDAISAPTFLAASENGHLVVSCTERSTYLFEMCRFKLLKKLENPATAASFLAEDKDSSIPPMIVLGSKYGGIHVYNYNKGCFHNHLKGHKGSVTGLASSKVLNILVSAGEDSKLCVWTPQIEMPELKESATLNICRGSSNFTPTHIQFDKVQKHVFAIQSKQIAICEAPNFRLVSNWLPKEPSTLIEDLTFSSDGKNFYVAFDHGIVGVFSGRDEWSIIEMIHLIDLNAYCPGTSSLVIAGHPSVPNLFAVGLSDGGVRIVEHDLIHA